jgi:homocysteine S-methyltransferase
VANLLVVTGDPSHSPLVDEGPDLDVDSIGAVNLVSRLNHGEDIGGNPIGKPTGFHAGVRLDPTAFDREREVRRFFWKVDAGAEFAITTPVFDPGALESLLADIAEFKVPVIATIWPLQSAREAEFFEHEMVDVPVPKGLVERMQQAEKNGTEAREGLAIARELAVALRDLVQGVQVYVPGGQLETALDVLQAL